MSIDCKQVTVVTVHYQTPDLLRTTVDSFRAVYPDVPYLVFDNGSSSASTQTLTELGEGGQWNGNKRRDLEEQRDLEGQRDLVRQREPVQVHREERNLFHGPALDKAIREMVTTPYCFFLDSDTETRRPGFLEDAMEQLEQDSKYYAAGRVIRVNHRGFKDPDGFPILLTPYLLLKTEHYRQFPPFVHHGQPGLRHFYDAQRDGFQLIDFPMHEYIDHLWRGTASKFGYRLGLRGKWDYLMNKLGW